MIVRDASQSQLRLGFMGTLLGDEELDGLELAKLTQTHASQRG